MQAGKTRFENSVCRLSAGHPSTSMSSIDSQSYLPTLHSRKREKQVEKEHRNAEEAERRRMLNQRTELRQNERLKNIRKNQNWKGWGMMRCQCCELITVLRNSHINKCTTYAESIQPTIASYYYS